MTGTITPTGRELRQRERAIAEDLGEKRGALSDVRRELDVLGKRYAQSDDRSALKAAERLCNRRDALADEIEDKQAEQTELLRMLGGEANGNGAAGHNGNGPRAGDGRFEDGWHQLVSELKPTAQGIEASVDLGSLMKTAQAATTITPSSGLTAPAYEVEGIVPLGRDVRFLYPLLRSQKVEQGDLAIQEFKQVGERKVTGSVERDPVAISEKAKLALGLELVTPTLKQLAVIADSVPSKLFDAVSGLGDSPLIGPPLGLGSLLLEWLREEMAFQLNRSLDAHAMAQLIAAKPAFGEVGTPANWINKIRNAVSAHRALGARPTILAVGPKVATELDTYTDKNETPIFALRDVGTASPLFGLNIVEMQGEEHAPILIDPMMLGITYFSLGTLLVDPFTGATKNLVNVRLEFDALFHVRDVSGAYAISKEALK